MPTTDRPLRKDAERNRRRIMDAAREVFAEHGLDAGLDQIARHAGLGVGTVYRRFPDKEGLIDALFEERVAAIAALAEEAAAHDDPWQGLVLFFERCLAEQAADRGFKQLLLGGTHGLDRVAEGRNRIAPPLKTLVERGQAAGALRAEVTPSDIAMLQLMLAGVMDASRSVDPDLWHRYLELFLDSLRPGRGSLRTPPLSDDSLGVVLAAWRPCR